MSRKEIGTQWDRDNRNAINENFKNLFHEFTNVVEVVSEKAYGDVIDAAKLNWQEPVSSQSNLPSEAEEGDTRFVRDTGKVYRFNGEEWNEIQQIDVTPINEVERRFNDNLNSVNQQLAQTDAVVISLNKVATQRSFLQLQQDFSLSEDRSPLYQVNGDRNVTFLFPTNGNEYLHYRFEKDSNDDFIKMREMAIYGRSKTLENYQEVTSGSMASTSSINNYTLTEGTIITHTFTGNSITMRHFCDDRGGVWRASIDGEFVKDISTHIDAVPNDEKIQDISGMTYGIRKIFESPDAEGTHTLELEFIGDDPEYPPRGGESRGWIFNTAYSNYVGPERTFIILGDIQLERNLSHNTSNKEFAFGVKPSESEYGTRWIPEHNGIGTIFAEEDGAQRLIVDNREVSMATAMNEYEDFKEAKMIQRLKFYHPEHDSPLGILIMITSIKDGKVRFSTTLKFERDTFVSGYVNMLPALNIAGDRLTTSSNKTMETTINDGSVTPIGEEIASNEYAFTSSNPDYANYFIGVKMDDQIITLGENYDVGVEHRTQNFQKLYPRIEPKDYSAGESYTFSGTFFIGKIENAVDFIR